MLVGPTVLKLEISSGHTHDSHVHNLHLTMNSEQRQISTLTMREQRHWQTIDAKSDARSPGVSKIDNCIRLWIETIDQP